MTTAGPDARAPDGCFPVVPSGAERSRGTCFLAGKERSLRFALRASVGMTEASFASVTFTGFSASTSSAGLSSRSPLKAACRTLPSPVQPANSISATRSGVAQCMLPSLGGLAPAANGLVLLSTAVQPRQELARRLLAEAGADPADIDQLLAAMHAHQQRAKLLARHRPAADHDLVAGPALGLDPVADRGPSGRVRRAAWRRCLRDACGRPTAAPHRPPSRNARRSAGPDACP